MATEERTMQIPASTRAAAMRLLRALDKAMIAQNHLAVREAESLLLAELTADQRQFGPPTDVIDPFYQQAGI